MYIGLLYEKSDHDGVCTSDESSYEAKNYKLVIEKHYINKMYYKYFLLAPILPYDIINVIMCLRIKYEDMYYEPYRKVNINKLNLYQKMYIMYEIDVSDKDSVEHFMYSNFKQKVNTKGSHYCLLCSSSKMNDLGKHDYRLTFY